MEKKKPVLKNKAKWRLEEERGTPFASLRQKAAIIKQVRKMDDTKCTDFGRFNHFVLQVFT